MPEAFDLVVLGAGPAGVGAAYRLATRGQRVAVLEREDRVGGLAGSFEVGGQRVDFGSHRLHPATDPAILSLLRELLGDDLQRRPRRGRIRLLGRWLAFPLRPGDLLRRLPPGFTASAAVDAVRVATSGRRDAQETFASTLLAGLGPTMCEHFYFPYARKLWGLEPDQLAAEQARRRVSADSPRLLLRRVLRGVGSSGAAGAFFWYPRRGYGQLWERLTQEAVSAGAEIRLGTAVRQVRVLPDRVEVDAGGSTLTAASVWSTLPLPLLARLIDPPPPSEVLAAAARLRQRAMVLVYLVLATDRYSRYDAHYLPGPQTPVTRVSEPKNYRDNPEDPPGRTVLCAEMPCAVGDPLWLAGEDALQRVARDALTETGLTDPRPEEVAVRRLASAYPVYDLAYEEAFATLDRWASRLPRLLTFGRQGLFAHDNAHHALSMAWAAADSLGTDGRFNQPRWSAARQRFRQHVVED